MIVVFPDHIYLCFFLLHNRAVNAKKSLFIRTILPDHLLLAYIDCVEVDTKISKYDQEMT